MEGRVEVDGGEGRVGWRVEVEGRGGWRVEVDGG